MLHFLELYKDTAGGTLSSERWPKGTPIHTAPEQAEAGIIADVDAEIFWDWTVERGIHNVSATFRPGRLAACCRMPQRYWTHLNEDAFPPAELLMNWFVEYGGFGNDARELRRALEALSHVESAHTWAASMLQRVDDMIEDGVAQANGW